MSTKLKNVKRFADFVTENVWAEPSLASMIMGGVGDATSGFLGNVVNKVKSLVSKDDPKDLPKADAGLVDGLIATDKIARNNTDPEAFKAKLVSICQALRINPNWMLFVMIKESDLDPKSRNPRSSASGLIQFMDSTARDLGTSISAIRNMSGIEQLDYVYKYYKPYAGKMSCVEDVYLVTFMPGYFSSRNDDSKNMGGSRIAALNGVVDLDSDGQIKMGEFKKYVTKNIPYAYRDAIAAKSNTYTA